LYFDATVPSNPDLGWLYVLSDNSAIIIDASADFPVIDNFATWSNLIVMYWHQNEGYQNAISAADGFYIQMLPDCNLATFITPTLSLPIIISSELQTFYISAFDDSFTSTYGSSINGYDTCGLRSCIVVPVLPYVTFDDGTQQFKFASLGDQDGEGSYLVDL